MSELSKLLEVITEVKNEMEKIDPSIKERLSYLNESLSESGDIIDIKEELGGFAPKETLREGKEVPGAQARARAIRMFPLIATEMTIGQKPSSEDRKIFDLWMGNIGIADTAAETIGELKGKITELTRFFADPKANLKTKTIPETLSYMMFLNQFVWMLKEFNASVAGFLWEPFLATLFGKGSRQVPTSEGDISDIKITLDGKTDASVSLKILNDAGSVGGSFSDLVEHFSKPENTGDPMRYVVVAKSQTKAGDINACTFYEFDIHEENFFEFMGHLAYTEVAEISEEPKKFTPEKHVGKRNYKWLRLVKKRPAGHGVVNFLQVLHAKVGGRQQDKVSPDWVSVAQQDRESGKWFVVGPGAEAVQLSRDGSLLSDGEEFLYDKAHTASPAEFGAGGRVRTKKGVKVSAPGKHIKYKYRPKTSPDMPGLAGADTDDIWGGVEEYGFWTELAKQMKEAGRPPHEFFQAVMGKFPTVLDQEIPTYKPKRGDAAHGAPGFVQNKQFHITPRHYKEKGTNLGTIKITNASVSGFFEEAAEKIGDDLTMVFNSLAELQDNIGRFFLVDCGGNACTKRDKAKRDTHGMQAIQNAKNLDSAVENAVKGVKADTDLKSLNK